MNIKSIILSLLAIGMGMEAEAKVGLTVTNNTKAQRHEIVEFDAKQIWQKLGIEEGCQLIVRNPYGLQVPSQLSHDGKLLVEVSVLPGGTAKLGVEPGIPDKVKRFVDGQLYAWRVDDFTWENDKCSYRAYGPALQRTGEQAFGFDVWLKSTPDLDVEKRYNYVLEGNELVDQLRKLGRKEEANYEGRAHSLHLDHGTGLDCYNVGPSLGCGTPAIMASSDSLVMPWAYKEFKVLDNGPLRFAVQFDYPEVTVGKQKVTEHRLVTLDKGSYFNHIDVWYDGLQKPTDVAGGFVVHTEDASDIEVAKDHIVYSDPTDSPERHQFQIYVGVLFPDGADKTMVVKDRWHKKQGIVGNAVGVKRGLKAGEKFGYWFGASWCEAGTPNFDYWKLQARTFIDNCRQPLQTAVVEK